MQGDQPRPSHGARAAGPTIAAPLRRAVAEATKLCALAMGVALLAWLSLALTHPRGRVAPIWLPNALWLTALMRRPVRHWPAIMIAGLVGNIGADLAEGDSWALAAGLAVANGVEAMCCAVAVRLLLRGRLQLDRLNQMGIFAGVAFASAAVGGAIGAGWLQLVSGRPLGISAAMWAGADALGLMTLTPPLLAIAQGALNNLRRVEFSGRAPLVLSSLAVVVLGSVIAPAHPLILLTPPVLIFAALQLEMAGAAIGSLLVMGAVLAFLGAGLAPVTMVGRSHAEQLLALQAFLFSTTLLTFPVAAVLARRRELEGALVEAHELAVRAEEISGVGHWRYDHVTGVMSWSRQMFRIYGLDPAETAPELHHTVTACHPEDRERLEAHRRDHADEDAEIEVRIIRPDGEVRHVVAKGTVEKDAAGRVTSRIGTLADVTGVKRAEAAARESEERYRVLAENAPDMITRTKLDGEVAYVSPSSVRVLGYTPEEMSHQNPQEMVHPDDLERVMAGIFRLIEERLQRLPEPIQYRARNKAGEWAWVEVNPTLVFNENGEPTEFIDVVRNITQAKLFEAELERARTHAEAAAAAKSAFLANMSHELRTPLTSIIGFSRLMGERPDLPSEATHYAKRISDASGALLAIINDVLDVSKLEAGQVELEFQPTSLNRLIEEAVGLIGIQAAAKGLDLRIKPDPTAPEQILTDASRLRQVLLNFLSNAVKFTEEGAVTIITAYREDGGRGFVRITVEDTGPGIPEDALGRLFERFSQAEVSINRTHGGTGLGLAISKGIVQLMGGTIGVETKVGQGSSFWFDISADPVAENSGQDRQRDLGRRRDPGPAAPRGRRHRREPRTRPADARTGGDRNRGSGRRRRSRGGCIRRAVRPDPDGPAHAGDGRAGGHPHDPRRKPAQPRHADPGPHCGRAAGKRPRLPGSRHGRRSGQAHSAPATAVQNHALGRDPERRRRRE